MRDRTGELKLTKGKSVQPYFITGAGPLTATVWKTGVDVADDNYEFNLFRTDARTGGVSQRFRPQDLVDFAKLIQVLAFSLADDGCLKPELRDELDQLANRMRSAAKPVRRRLARRVLSKS